MHEVFQVPSTKRLHLRIIGNVLNELYGTAETDICFEVKILLNEKRDSDNAGRVKFCLSMPLSVHTECTSVDHEFSYPKF